MIDKHNEITAIELAVSGARTSTFTGAAVDISQMIGVAKVILTSAAGTGTTPTLDGKIETGDLSNGSDAADLPGVAFSQVINAVSFQSIAVDTRACKRFIRFVGTIAGGTPSFNFSVVAVGERQVK